MFDVVPYRNEDMSAYVKKVHFKLHDSYANPNRILTKPPYEVSQPHCRYRTSG
jgi:YEATS domain-containing protein 4